MATFGIATALMNTFFYLAIERIPLGKGVAIEFIGPISVAALRTRSRRNALALLCAAVGVAVLSGVELSGEPLGLLFIFLASVMWATYIVVGSRVAQQNRGVSGLGLGLAIGALVVTPIGLPGSGPVWAAPHLLFLCFFVGVMSNAVGYGIDHTGCCADGTQLTHAFDPQDIVGARNRLVGVSMKHGWHDVCARCRIVHQTTGQQLAAFGVVNHAF